MVKLIRLDGFSIEYEMLPGYLRAYVFDGVDSIDVSMRMWTMLGQLCDRHGADRLLALEDLRDEAPVDGFDQLAKVMLDAGFARRRVAFVELTNQNEGNQIAELICLDQGMTIMVFTQEYEARAWLLYGEGPSAESI